MKLELESKVALITGSTGEIGGAIARLLAAEGAVAIIHGRNEAKASEIVKLIKQDGGEAHIVMGALDSDDEANNIISTVLKKFGSIDILINNAGIFDARKWEEGSAKLWMDTYNTSVASMVRMIQGFVPAMKAKGWGRVIQISSVAATQAPQFYPDYAAAKAAILNMTVSLMKDLWGSGITVNTVSPGSIDTGTWEEYAREIGKAYDWPNDIDLIKKNLLSGYLANPTNRFGLAEDVANAVVFLASTKSSYINGVNLKVDGGINSTLG